ncbi:hypothetical protein ScPMuIL_005713 [Solemya velum]
MLVRQSADRIQAPKEKNMLEFMPKERIDSIQSPRVLNTHSLFSDLPKDFLKKKCKIIYMMRNPKDVAVSFYNHLKMLKQFDYKGAWQDFLPIFMKGKVVFGTYFDVIRDWEESIEKNPDHPIHVLTYEALKENGVEEVIKLAEFLGLSPDRNLIDAIVSECSFKKMKAEKKHEEFNGWFEQGYTQMYRKGEVGDWKNWFTVAQNEMFDAVYAQEMSRSKLRTFFNIFLPVPLCDVDDMPVVKVKDDAGDSLTVLDVGGKVYYPTFPIPDHENEVKSIPDWHARDDDILICAYPKSGTHWIWEIVLMLLRGKAERIQEIKEVAMLEGVTQAHYNNLPSPRVLNSHIYFSNLPQNFRDRKCKIIYILRNPKDVSVSYYNHHTKLRDYEYEGEWKNYLPRFIQGKVDYGSWFDYVREWHKVIEEGHPSIHVLTYEDVKKDGVNEIKRLAKFLEIKDDMDLFEGISAECDFKKMKTDKDPLEIKEEWRDGLPGMYRKGEVGDWKNWFTVAQNEMFDAVYAEKMKNCNVKIQFSKH